VVGWSAGKWVFLRGWGSVWVFLAIFGSIILPQNNQTINNQHNTYINLFKLFDFATYLKETYIWESYIWGKLLKQKNY